MPTISSGHQPQQTHQRPSAKMSVRFTRTEPCPPLLQTRGLHGFHGGSSCSTTYCTTRTRKKTSYKKDRATSLVLLLALCCACAWDKTRPPEKKSSPSNLQVHEVVDVARGHELLVSRVVELDHILPVEARNDARARENGWLVRELLRLKMFYKYCIMYTYCLYI